MIETTVVEPWLQSLLTGDTALNAQNGGRVYAYLAPPNATFPCTVYAPMSLGGLPALGSQALARDLYFVKMIGANDNLAALDTGANRIDALLEGTIATSGGLTIRVRKQQSVSYIETMDNSRFAHSGAVYRIYAS